VEAGRIDAERVESIGQLLASPRYEPRHALDLELRVFVDLLPRLRVAPRHPGQDQCLRLRPRLREPALDEDDVQASLRHGETVVLYEVRTARPLTISAKTDVSAGISRSIASASSAARLARVLPASTPSTRTNPSSSRMSSTTWNSIPSSSAKSRQGPC